MKVFMDTSALIANYNVDDIHHIKAIEVMEKIREGEIPLTSFYITDYVFDEAVTFIKCVLDKPKLATTIGEALLTSALTTMIRVDEDIFEEAWALFKQNKGYSFTDCTSFSVMKRYDITHAFTFDKHFENAGFKMIPQTRKLE